MDATGGGRGLASFGFWVKNEGGFLFVQYKQKLGAFLDQKWKGANPRRHAKT
jgi:hypothetical protein